MQSIDEFMRSYFAKWVEMNLAQEANCQNFQAEFFSGAYLHKQREGWAADAAYQRAHPAVIVSIENHGETADVITSHPLGRDHERRLYHLRHTENGWQIERRGWQCFECKGSGCSYEASCTSCKGKGWLYYGASRQEKKS